MVEPQHLTHRHTSLSLLKPKKLDAAENGAGPLSDTVGHGHPSSKKRWSRRRLCLVVLETLRSERRRAMLALLTAAAALSTSAFAALPAAAAARVAGRRRPPAIRPVVRPRILVAPSPWRREGGPTPPEPPRYVPGRSVDHRIRADRPWRDGESYHFERGDCVAVREWQLGHRPTCNALHEVRIEEMKGDAELVNGGAFRDVWRILDFDMETPRAFKSMHFDRHGGGHKVYQMFRSEAVAMDHLTRSPYVANMYGFCALSALYDFSTGGTFKEKARKGLLSSKEKLRLALHVAKATRDVHDLDDEGVVTMAVADFSSGQFVLNDETGIYQLMDLNWLRMMTWDKETHEPCGFNNTPSAGKVRAPEEYARGTYFDETIDLWALGNVLHLLITGDYAFCAHDCSRNSIARLVEKGVRPPSYDDIEEKGDPIEMEILHVVKNTRVTAKEDRWPAKKAAQYLEDVWRKVENGELQANS